MKITDETLSAFLDGELPAPEMEALRECLSQDEELSNRLAELAAVDPMVATRYSAIDERPLPEAVQGMLADDNSTSAQVIAFPLWRRAQRGLQQQFRQHAAIAAGIALALGFGIGQLLPEDSNGSDRALAEALESTPSGNTVQLNGEQLTPRLSFMNRQGQYCRQFQLSGTERASENIACRGDGEDWEVAASVQLGAIQRPDSYQTASGGSLLDSALDQMMAGDALDPEAEQEIIANRWNK